MPLTNTSYKYQFGVEIGETGMNKISKSLRIKRPEFFEKKTDIPIKSATTTSKAHILTLYSLINKNSLIFDIHPITGNPQIKEDTISLTVGMDFSLTDNIKGFITKLGIDIKATVTIVRTDKLQVFLREFKVLKITGKHPNFSMQLINNKLDATKQLTDTYRFSESSDKQLADSFTAIVNYLIDLFLQDALVKAIVEFPVPDISSIIKFGRLVFGRDELRGPYLRNNSFYTMLGADLGIPVTFPSEHIPKNDLRVGISESGLERVSSSIFPMRLPDADITKPYNTFYVTARNLQIEKASFNIRPGENTIGSSIFFSGLLQVNIQFDVPVIHKHVDIPIPIPFDKLSHYRGIIEPYLVVDPANNPDASVHLHLKPHAKFLDAWYLFVLTDYRGYFIDVIRRWVDRFKDNFIIKFFRKIPIIGWLLDKVIDMTGWIIGFAIGTVLDMAVSTFLNVLINVVGRALLQFFFTPDFDIYKLEQKPLRDMTGLSIGSGQIVTVSDGRGGELELRLLFDTPIPTVRPSLQMDPINVAEIKPQPLPEIPGMKTLQEYKLADFNPVVNLPAPSFQTGGERYSLSTKIEERVYTGFLSINYFQQEENWILQKTMNIPDASAETVTLIYQKDFKPISFELNNGASSGTSYQITGENDFTTNTTIINSKMSEGDSVQRKINLFPAINLEFSDFWIYRLAHTDVTKLRPGKFSRVDIESYFQYTNWARIIPVEIKSITEFPIQKPHADNTKPPVTIGAVKLICSDDEGSYEIVILKSGGLYSATLTTADITIQLNSVA